MTANIPLVLTEDQKNAARMALYHFLKAMIAEYPLASTMINEAAQRKLAEEGAEKCCKAIEEA